MSHSRIWLAGQFKNGETNTGGSCSDYSDDYRLACSMPCTSREDALKTLKLVISTIKRKRKQDPAYQPGQDPYFATRNINILLYCPLDF